MTYVYSISAGPQKASDYFDQEDTSDEHGDNPLWHYTDAAGLQGILSSGKIRATHVAHLNDPTEIVHGEELVSLFARNLKWPEEYVHGNAALRKFADEWPTSRVSALTDAFVASFCADDGNRLSQWRGYGGAGLGYSIGFRRVSIAQKEPVRLFKVTYQTYQPGANVNKLDEAFRTILRVVERDVSRGIPADEAIAKSCHEMIRRASLAALRLKHDGFKEEQEWRLIAAGDFENSPVSRPDFRPAARGLIPYVEVDLRDESGRLPLRKIFVGPAHNAQSSVKAVQGLLKSRGYPDADELVEASGIPFRAT